LDTVSARAEPALLDAVGQLVLVLGVDGCKRLHYELCVATRSEATRRMLAAVRGLARLYGALNLRFTIATTQSEIRRRGLRPNPKKTPPAVQPCWYML
jgi:hypothetical protein